MKTTADLELADVARVLASLPRRIHEIVSGNAARNPGAEALREGECAWTYAELATATDAVASRLQAAGVRAGDRVMLVGENCAALVALMFGTRWFATLYGFAFVSHQVGGFLGVWLGGILFERTGSYNVVWWLSVFFGVASALINLPIVEKPVGRFAPAAV